MPDSSSQPIDIEAERIIFEGTLDPVAGRAGLRLLAALEEARRERDDARATHQELATEFERLRDVYTKVLAYRRQEPGGGHLAAKHRAMFAAVDSYEKTQESTDGE